MKLGWNRGELLVAPALKAVRHGDGRIGLTRKFVEGMAAYARYWPGPVTALMQEAEGADSNLDHLAVPPDELPFSCEWLPADRAARTSRLERAAALLATLDQPQLPWLEAAARTGTALIWVTESSPRTRRQMIAAQVPGLLRRQKRQWDTTRLESRFRHAVGRAAGVQCNGTPTFADYRSLNPRGLLFFDSRVRSGMLASDGDIAARSRALLQNAPLRLVFSGRLTAIKGVDDLPFVARELRRLGVPFTLDIYGGGDREAGLRATIRRLSLDDIVRLRGTVDFETQLMPAVKTQADLFVCCHPQGDPSCTYLETLACGTPIAGYGNEAWRGLAATAGTGWVTPLGRPARLARAIAALHADRPALAEAAYAARDFARLHDFDATMRTRVDHLRDCLAQAKRP